MLNANLLKKSEGVIMKKYIGLLIIVLMLPLMSQEKACAASAIISDDISKTASGAVLNTEEIPTWNESAVNTSLLP